MHDVEAKNHPTRRGTRWLFLLALSSFFFFFYFIDNYFWYFCLYYDKTVSRQNRRVTRLGKVHESGLKLRTPKEQWCYILWFSGIFWKFEHFSSSECMILWSIFSHWGQLRDSYTTITKGFNIHWCSRRKHNALRAEGEHFCTGWMWAFL